MIVAAIIARATVGLVGAKNRLVHQSVIITPASTPSVDSGFIVDAKLTTPIFKSLRSAVDGYIGVVLLVVLLNFHSCVSNIIRRITFFIFDPIERMLVARSWPHISVEVFKAFNPSSANGYASATVSVKASVIGVITPVFHITPCSVFCGFGHVVIFFCAAATHCCARFQVHTRNYFYRFFSARAGAEPSRVSIALSRIAKHSESAEHIAGTVNKLSVNRMRLKLKLINSTIDNRHFVILKVERFARDRKGCFNSLAFPSIIPLKIGAV